MDTRERIKDAAVRLFGTRGFRGATTRRIAEMAGVNEVTLFRQFGSTERLLTEALAEAASREVTGLPEVPVDPWVEVETWCRRELGRLHAVRSVLRTSIAEFEEHPEVASCGGAMAEATAEELAGYLRRLTEAGITTAVFDPVAASAMLMGAVFSDAVSRDVMPARYPYDLDVAAREYTRTLLRGLGVTPGEEAR